MPQIIEPFPSRSFPYSLVRIIRHTHEELKNIRPYSKKQLSLFRGGEISLLARIMGKRFHPKDFVMELEKKALNDRYIWTATVTAYENHQFWL